MGTHAYHITSIPVFNYLDIFQFKVCCKTALKNEQATIFEKETTLNPILWHLLIQIQNKIEFNYYKLELTWYELKYSEILHTKENGKKK